MKTNTRLTVLYKQIIRSLGITKAVDAATKEILTCGRFLEQSIKLSGVFKNFDVVSENTITYFIPVAAAFYIGTAVAFSNPDCSEGELKHNLLISKPKLIFASESALDTVLKVKEEIDFIETVLLMSHKSRKHSHIDSFIPDKFDCSQQIAYICLSSGTTGLPKGLMLTHQNLRTAIAALGHARHANIVLNDTTVAVAPFFHLYGNLAQLLTLSSSMQSVIMHKFDPDLFLKFIEEYKATKLFIVTPIAHFIAKSSLVKDYDLSSIEIIYVAGAPFSKESQIESARRLGKASVRQLYGLTETTGPSHMQLNNHKPGSVGNLIPGTMAKVWNPDTAQDVGRMENGEICFKGPPLMRGYLPEQDCFDENGFFHTGDIGYYDHNGCFYIVDRIKDLIKYKAFQVSLVELEALLLTHPVVKNCGVIWYSRR